MFIPFSRCVMEPSRHGNPKRVILRGGVLPDVTQVAVALFGADECVEPHAHPSMYEIYYVLEGQAAYTVGSETHLAGPGDMVIVPPGAVHHLRVLSAPHEVFYWGIATGDL